MVHEMNLNLVDRWMCSVVCPCPTEYEPLWREAYNESTLRDVYHRTWSDQPIFPFESMQFGRGPLQGSTQEYESFEQCYNDKIQGKSVDNSLAFREAVEHFSLAESLAELRKYEKEFQCSSFCDLPLFYFSKDLSFGPPQQDCIDVIIQKYTDNYSIAAITLSMAVLFWLACLASIPHCAQ